MNTLTGFVIGVAILLVLVVLVASRNWDTMPGLNFIGVHLNRIIPEYDLNKVIAPGHSAPEIVANTYLEGAYSEYSTNISQDADRMKTIHPVLGSRRHPQPHSTLDAGSIHEGG